MSDICKDTYIASANENLFGVSDKVSIAIQAAFSNLHRYPEPHSESLISEIANKLQIEPNKVLVGSGSAELISLLIRALCKAGKASNILACEPTYPLYRSEAEALGVAFESVPLNSNYEFVVDSILSKINSTTQIVFISNPNNPTGGYLTHSQIEQLITAVPTDVVLVLDEAYVEFVDAPDYGSGLPFLAKYSNLAILRTFSKAYGLASVRVGYLIAQDSLIQQVMQVKQPYNVNHIAQVAAIAALNDTDHLEYTLKQTLAGKQHLQTILDSLGVQWWPSQGNFLYIDAGIPAHLIEERLQKEGVQLRRTESNYGLRVTIGPKLYQECLHEKLKVILEPVNIWEDAVLAEILKVGYHIALSDENVAAQAITNLSKKANPHGSAPERIALAFLRAFSEKLGETISHKNAGNLYSSSYGATDMISAFDVLMTETPLVKFGHYLANLTIAKTVSGASEVHLLDLGIGSGYQWIHLIDLLTTNSQNKIKLKITGIDIPVAGDEENSRLQLTGQRLKDYAHTKGIELSFIGISQKLEEIDLRQLPVSTSEILIVNSAFTLHHLPDQLVSERDFRDRILEQIKALKPALFSLVEPDSEHNRLSFVSRLRESLRHYFTVFDVLETLLPPVMPERQIIEQEFFGREIINVISCEGSNRVERHERNEAWQQRMTRNGFKKNISQVGSIEVVQALELHENFSLANNGAGYTLCWKETPIVAATFWS